jgi:NAD-dependent deacetylase
MGADRLADLVRTHQPCVAVTGAGISTESGIPDFRSAGGIWQRFDPMTYAHIDALRREPATVWEFYGLRVGAASDAEPTSNAAAGSAPS